MKPYPNRNLTIDQLILKYRLSRARRILVYRFRVFLSPILLSTENTKKVALVSCVLHSYLQTKCPTRCTPPEFLDKEMRDATISLEDWRNESVMKPLGQQGSNRYGLDAKEIRESYLNNYVQVYII